METCPVCGQEHVWIHKKISFIPFISIIESKPFDGSLRVTQCSDGAFTYYVHPERDKYYRTQPVIRTVTENYTAEDIEKILEPDQF